MWDSENERLGLKSCTPLGYTLIGVGGLIGTLLGLLALLAVPVYLAYRFFTGQLSSALLWLLLTPFGFGILGRVFFEVGWMLALRKQFRYDSARTAWWNDGGEIRSFPPEGGSGVVTSDET
jgi:hypothetical protein